MQHLTDYECLMHFHYFKIHKAEQLKSFGSLERKFHEQIMFEGCFYYYFDIFITSDLFRLVTVSNNDVHVQNGTSQKSVLRCTAGLSP